MALAPLWVSIRTTGAAALSRLSASFLRLRASMRVAFTGAWMRFITGGGLPGAFARLGARIRGLPRAVLRLGASFRALAGSIASATRSLIMYALASRLAQAASSGLASGFKMLLPLMAKWAAIGAAIVAVGLPLIGVVGNLIPIVMLLAPAAATAGVAMVALKLAFNGIGDALQAGLSGDTEEFEKALKKLSPSAADTVRTLVKLRDEWKPLQKLVQEKIFHGVAGELKGLSGAIKPVADKWLPLVAESFARTRGALHEGLANFARSGDLDKVIANVTTAIDSLLGAIKPVARAFGDILVVAAPAFAKISGYIRDAATAFGDWIRKSKENGNLQKWLDKAMDTFGKLKDIGVEVGRIIGAIFKSSGDEGDDMLDQIRNALRGIADWANGDTGQKVINTLSGILKFFGQLAPVFALWAGWFEGMLAAVKYAWDGITAVFRGAVALWLGYLGALIGGAAKAFGWIPGIGPKLKAAAAEFNQFAANVNRALDGIQDETVNITYRSQVIGDRRVSGAQLSGTYSSGIGGRAVGGPMRPGVTYRINEQGDEFIQLGGTGGRAYTAQQSAGMFAGGGGGAPTWNGPMTGLEAMFFTFMTESIRKGKLKLS